MIAIYEILHNCRVAKPADIDAAVAVMVKNGYGLYGLVNNAGVVTIGPLIDTKPEEFDLVMTVNVYGPYRMTKAFTITAHASIRFLDQDLALE